MIDWAIRIAIVLLLAALSLTCTMILRELKDIDVIIIQDTPALMEQQPWTA